MSRLGWWELSVVAAKLGFGRERDVMRLVRRLRRNGMLSDDDFRAEQREGVASYKRTRNQKRDGTNVTQLGTCTIATGGLLAHDDFSAEGREIKAGRGRKANVVHLSLFAVKMVAAHAQTPEAVAFRFEVFDRAGGMPSNALPAAPSSHDPAVWAALEQLRNDFTALAVRQGEVEQLVERRVTKQLTLPMAVGSSADVYDELLAAMRALNSGGVTSREILRAIAAGNPHALLFRDAVKAVNGGRFPCVTAELGRVLQRIRSAVGDALEAHWQRGHVRRWVAVEKGVH